MNQYQGAKKIIFTACHPGKLKLAFTSPDFISTSSKSFLMSRIYFTVLLLFEFLKKHHLPVGQVKNRIHQPDSKIHQPWAIGHYFLCTLQYISKSYTMSKNTIDRQHTERGQLQCQLLLQFIASFNAPSQSPQANTSHLATPPFLFANTVYMLHVLIESYTSYQSPKAHISHLTAPPFLFALTVIYRKLHIIIGTTSPILVTPAMPYPTPSL